MGLQGFKGIRWSISAKFLLVSSLLLASLGIPTAEAISFRQAPATNWVHVLASDTEPTDLVRTTSPLSSAKNLEAVSKFDVTYNNFPDWAKKEVQDSLDIWAANFRSTVPITVDATWERSKSENILGSARGGSYFSSFPGAPDPGLWYVSALANALSGKDLDKNNPEIVIQVNSEAPWNSRGDGKPTRTEYDLRSVFLHEVGHGLGFSSNDSYELVFGVGTLTMPTPFDAYLQTEDGKRLADLPSPSRELGTALTSSLVWSGALGVKANGGVKPKMFTPPTYEPGSSTSHLDESSFTNAGLDSVMTPRLDSGEIFVGPGPLMLAMMEDLRNKPPAGITNDLPLAPRNASALIGDASALITFDAPANIRTSQVSEYIIKNIKTGVKKTSVSSPVVFSGLKNGTSYTFSVVAKNALGESVEAKTKSVTPQASWKSSIFDDSSEGSNLASTVFNGKPAVAYNDSKTGDLKLATFNGKTWRKTVVDGQGGIGGRTSNDLAGAVSVCVNGVAPQQTMHIFYSDQTEKDLRYATYDGKNFAFEIVDGNGPSVNNYEDPIRVRTSSDVSISNACVARASDIQVFYRDQTQGVTLGAVKLNGGTWQYELVDGDRATDGRSTGDVSFHMKAALVGQTTYLVYDSVTGFDERKNVTAGSVRMASRTGVNPFDWQYRELDIATDKSFIAGYDVAITNVGKNALVTWLAGPSTTPGIANEIRWVKLDAPKKVSRISSGNFGRPGEHLSTDGKTIVYNCQERLCAINTDKKIIGQNSIRLVSSPQQLAPIDTVWVNINGSLNLLAGKNGKVVFLKP
ncbi:MAG: hypothetical protein RL147_619 [Actinomycetota bacterium]